MRPHPPRRGRALAAAFSLGGHLLILCALLQSARQVPPPAATLPAPVAVTLVRWSPPPLPAAKPDPGKRRPSAASHAVKAAEAKPAPPTLLKPRPPRPRPVPGQVRPLPAPAAGQRTPDEPRLGDAELASATTADGGGAGGGSGAGAGSGSGSGAGACNMVRRLQAALRRSAGLSAAIEQAHHGGPVMVWNGDWVQSAGEDGRGLAGVRQAIMVEVAFAPPECRRQPMRGLVLLSMSDTPGGARLVLGQQNWRWSDLLFAKGVAASGGAF